MQKRYVWLTDTHFNFLSKAKLFDFFISLRELKCDGIMISGDISTGSELSHHISFLLKVTEIPIFWINGNHDFYGSSFQEVRESMLNLVSEDNRLHYLTLTDYVPLGKSAALIGHDGWCDSRWRVPLTSLVFCADFLNIRDFRELKNNAARLDLVRKLADTATSSISTKLNLAFQKFDTVYLLTHFPPWPKANPKWYDLIDSFWRPYNYSKVLADCIESTMQSYPNKKIVVLAGHTHKKRIEKITDNIELRVGEANVGRPEIEDILLIE